VVASVEKVEASMDGSYWTSLGDVKATFDLQALQNGRSAVLVSDVPVSPGAYTRFRITWSRTNYASDINQAAYAILSGGKGKSLTMPLTTVIPGYLRVDAHRSATGLLMLSGQQAVCSRADNTLTFQATGTALGADVSVTLTGTLADGATPLPGVEVLAETTDGANTPAIQRRAFTDASGRYTMEGLNMGSLYFVVAQPVAGSVAYAARAASPVNAASPGTYQADLAFSAPGTPGSLDVTVTPASGNSQVTWVDLRQILSPGATSPQVLIVRSRPLLVGTDADKALLDGLYPDTFGVMVQRSTSGGTPVVKVGAQVVVSSGGTTKTTLAY
jgi:hypothetical protein